MPVRPGWHDEYWKKMDKDTQEKLRTTCPKCGSSETYYNEQFKLWRCARCEASFKIKGFGDKRPWWKRMFGKKS